MSGCQGREEIGPSRIQHVVFGEGAGGDDAGDFAANQSFGKGGVFDLVANGDALARVEQFPQIGVEVLMAKAGHRDDFVATGERQANERDAVTASSWKSS